MDSSGRPAVAIVDYGMGNLFSVKHACEHVGLESRITSKKKEILSSDVVILPGIGAFGDAMSSLKRLDLVGPLKDVAASPKPFLGVCLGLQLLMEESSEFGAHRGLEILRGRVARFDNSGSDGLKVPQVCWNRIFRVSGGGGGQRDGAWGGEALNGVPDGGYMYFVHSYYVAPSDADLVMTVTRYGPVEFCSSLQYGNIFACQFHPERSGVEGLKIYRNLAAAVSREG